ncbi:NfeD family protein [Actinomyces radicidentis]|uniref:NfeD family protein n=1 Tax=Actinomyces radicidentis TaxID=111015 RepID=UPI0028E64068|nr:NfeD family protein [Actinomyces radicidentis]
MAWLWWLGAALVLGVIETLTADLTFIMFAGGGLGGSAAAALGAPFWAQVVVFAVVSTLLLGTVRPWIKGRWAASAPNMRTNVDAQIGREATALTALDAHGGRVRLGGEEWSARLAESPGGYGAPARLQPGARVRVVSIDGAVAVVEPA